MSLSLLILAAVFAWLLGRLRRRRLAVLVAVATLLVFLGIGCGLVPRVLLYAWEAPYAQRPAPAWSGRDVIVLLTAGMTRTPGGRAEPGSSAYGRIAQAAILYRQCHAGGGRCTVLVSGGDALLEGEPLARTYAPTLRALGVPSADLVLEEHSMNTWQNARYVRPLLKDLDPGRVWLVSAATHLRRAQLAFGLFGVTATPVRADYLRGEWSVLPLGANFADTDAVLHEMVGYLEYRGFGWLGRARQEARADAATPPPDAPSPTSSAL